MISFEANFDMNAIHAYMEKKLEEEMDRVVSFLREKGIQFTTKAREKAFAATDKKYNNITYNLVSSVGFSIARSGVIVESYFPLEGTGAEGKAKGEALAERVAREIGGEYIISLVLTAGEDYAIFVERKHGMDVVTGSSDRFVAYLNEIWGANK